MIDQDQVDAAIEKAELKNPHPMVKLDGMLATGKPFTLVLPADLDALDTVCLHDILYKAFQQVQQANLQRQGALQLPDGSFIPMNMKPQKDDKPT